MQINLTARRSAAAQKAGRGAFFVHSWRPVKIKRHPSNQDLLLGVSGPHRADVALCASYLVFVCCMAGRRAGHTHSHGEAFAANQGQQHF
jgi:hypothetical protein